MAGPGMAPAQLGRSVSAGTRVAEPGFSSSRSSSMTRPETTNCVCAVRAAPPLAPPPPPASVSSATTLRSELPEVFRIQVLEIGFQVVGAERRGARLSARFPGLDRGERQQAFAREDRRLEAQRDGDRV